MKADREKEERKNKEPKEQIIIDLGERKNKTVKNDQKDKKLTGSSKSSFESTFNERGQALTKENAEKLCQNKNALSDIVQDSADAKSKW